MPPAVTVATVVMAGTARREGRVAPAAEPQARSARPMAAMEAMVVTAVRAQRAVREETAATYWWPITMLVATGGLAGVAAPVRPVVTEAPVVAGASSGQAATAATAAGGPTLRVRVAPAEAEERAAAAAFWWATAARVVRAVVAASAAWVLLVGRVETAVPAGAEL